MNVKVAANPDNEIKCCENMGHVVSIDYGCSKSKISDPTQPFIMFLFSKKKKKGGCYHSELEL